MLGTHFHAMYMRCARFFPMSCMRRRSSEKVAPVTCQPCTMSWSHGRCATLRDLVLRSTIDDTHSSRAESDVLKGSIFSTGPPATGYRLIKKRAPGSGAAGKWTQLRASDNSLFSLTIGDTTRPNSMPDIRVLPNGPVFRPHAAARHS